MSVEDVAAKVEWEGGVYETAVDYGLPADEIDDATPEGAALKAKWLELVEAGRVTSRIVTEIEQLLDAE